MKDISLFWSKVIVRNDYLFTYYALVLALFISQFFFTVNDAQAMIPLYGIFSAVMTIQIISLHQRYQMDKIFLISIFTTRKIILWQWILGFVLTSPAFILLGFFEKYVYVDTPIINILVVIIIFHIFTISIPFLVATFFSNQYASILILVVIYFVLMLMHGYKLEIIQYIAPTLNFMYPDNQHYLNFVGVLFLCICSMAAAVCFSKRPTLKKDKYFFASLASCSILAIICLHLYEEFKENELMSQPYESYVFNEITVQYKGVSQKRADRFSAIYSDLTQQMAQFGIKNPYQKISITKDFNLPINKEVGNIISINGKTIEIRPYSNKFFEFNYGYNIIEDLLNILMNETWKTEKQTVCYELLKKIIEQKVILNNNSDLFSEAKLKTMKNEQFHTTSESYMTDYLTILKEKPQDAYSFIIKLENQ